MAATRAPESKAFVAFMTGGILPETAGARQKIAFAARYSVRVWG